MRRPPVWIRLLLRLYPTSFRQDHGAELVDFVRKERESARYLGTGGHLRFWLRVPFDLVRAAWRLRGRRTSDPGRRRRSLHGLELDLRYALRSLRGAPLVSAVVVILLAVGIGLNTAIFSVVNGVLLEPLPYRQPQRLVYVSACWVADGIEEARHTAGDFRDLRREISSFADVAAATGIRQNLTGGEIPLHAQVGWVSPNLFSLVGVESELGRPFVADEPPGSAMLSHSLWQRHFGGDSEILGATLHLDGHPYTVVGVLPAGFRLYLPRFPSQIDVWKVPDDRWQNGDVWGENARGGSFGLFQIVARLTPEATLEEARGEVAALASGWRESFEEYARAGLELDVAALQERVLGDTRPTLLMLFGAVALVLLIACANVIHLMLARAQVRAREIALRLALGSSRRGIVRLLLAEGLVLALLGGMGGVALALFATPLLVAMRPEELARADATVVDITVLAFALASSLLCTLLFGLLPGLAISRRFTAVAAAGLRATATLQRQRLGRLLVVAQISLSLILLVAAGLLATSMRRLQAVETGLDDDSFLTFAVSLPGTEYERPHGTDRFLRQLETRIESLPGVRSAGVVWPMPLSGRNWSGPYSAGAATPRARAYAEYRLATPGLFETLGSPLLEGRNFSPEDRRHVVLVNQQLARRAWPDRSALGRLLAADPWGGGDEEFEIVGVVEDIRYADLREPPMETIYFDSRGWSWTDWEVDFMVSVQVPPASLVAPIQAQLAKLDPRVPLARARPFSAYVDENLATNRFVLRLIGLFGTVAAVLASLGLYGLLSYSVAQRHQELGIRMALGARQSGILRLVLSQGLKLAVVGVLLGVLGAVALTPLLSSLLFDVGARDPVTFAWIALLLFAAATFACYLPARRATRLDPIAVLRSE